MKTPPHPGQHVLKDCLEPLGLSITKAAEALGVTRLTLSNLVNGRNGISPEMSIRLAKALAAARRCGSACRWITTWRRR